MAKWVRTYETVYKEGFDSPAGRSDSSPTYGIDYETRIRFVKVNDVYYNEDNSIVIARGFDMQPGARVTMARMANEFSCCMLNELGKLYSPEGALIPKSWMPNGSVVVDYEHNRVIAADVWSTRIRYETPESVPNSNTVFQVCVPDPKKAKGALKALADQRTVAVAAARMSELRAQSSTPSPSRRAKAIQALDITSDPEVQMIVGRVDEGRWKEMVKEAFIVVTPMPYLMLHP